MKVPPAAWAIALIAMLSTSFASAEDAKPTTLAKGLKNVAGVAVQPETGKVFVSDSAGKRVISIDPKSGDVTEVITGFPLDVYGKGPMYDIGPLGLAFVDKDTLVVAGGGLEDVKELVRVYDVSKAPLTADDMKYALGPIKPDPTVGKGEGNFYGVAVGKMGIVATANGDDTKGWTVRAKLKKGKPGKLETYIATKEATNVDAPVGITISKEGNVVVGQMGEITLPNDSLLTVYDPKTKKLLVNAETGLFDITGLAFSPKTGKLYATDFAWMDAAQGGLFRLDMKTTNGKVTVEAVKIASLERPTALAFGENGDCYVTVFNAVEPGDDEVLVFKGL